MNQKGDIKMYEGLASYFLPEGVLDYFELPPSFFLEVLL